MPPLPSKRRATHLLKGVGSRVRGWVRASLGPHLLLAPVDPAGLAAFRILFGIVMFAGTVRFLLSGYVEAQYGAPRFFFHYWGLPSPAGMGVTYVTALLVALAASCVLITLGLFYRAAIIAFTVGFITFQLMDVTNYLNHYVLVAWLAILLSILPAHAALSLDARRRPALRRAFIPAWMLNLVRFQVAVVYLFAALAKVGPDWLGHGQPLGLWLHARNEWPVLGAWFDRPETPLLMSWAGFLYDATIVGWLSWRRTRPFAYAAVLVFHAFTFALFEIGMFPFIMVAATTVFFAPRWPRRFLRGARPAIPTTPPVYTVPRAALVALGVYAAFHLLVPLRFLLYPGDVLWHEQGMRFAWKVMVREKQGSVTYHVRDPKSGRAWQVSPHEHLTWRQVSEMSGQPDLILQLAHHIADDFAARGHPGVEVRAETAVSLNGRPAAPLIDPQVDLTTVKDGLGRAAWILPRPDGPPPSPHLLAASR